MFKQTFSISSLTEVQNSGVEVDVDVGRNIRAMDEQYGTQFESWIRNESNIDCVIFYLHKFVIEFEDTNPSTITRAIKWIVQGWSVHKSAELLIKLLYHWGIGHSKFAYLVAELCQDWRMPLVVDLVTTLVIGETSNNASSFIQHFTQAWEPFMVIQLCRNVATRLRWNDRYCYQFLLRYASLTYPKGPTQQAILNQIQQEFEIRSKMLHRYYEPSNTPSSSFPLSPVDFTMSVLEIMIRDYKVYQGSHHKNPALSNSKTHFADKQIAYTTPGRTFLRNNELAKASYEETPELHNRTYPCPSGLLEKLNAPSPPNPNDGRGLRLPRVSE